MCLELQAQRVRKHFSVAWEGKCLKQGMPRPAVVQEGSNRTIEGNGRAEWDSPGVPTRPDFPGFLTRKLDKGRGIRRDDGLHSDLSSSKTPGDFGQAIGRAVACTRGGEATTRTGVNT